MVDMRVLAAQRNLANAEKLGQSDRVKRVKARLVELQRSDKPVDRMNKTELLAEAEAQGIEVDETSTKKEIAALLGEET